MTWTEIVGEANRLADEFRRDGSIAWFRGHRDAEFELTSTIHRYMGAFARDFKEAPDPNARRQLLRDVLKTQYRRFKQDAWPLLDPRERSEWGVVFAMQHYGMPTRLLDWTENFACAVFFAQLHRDRANEAAIWVLDPQALNHGSLGREELVALDDNPAPGTFDPRPHHPARLAPPGDLRSIAVSPLFTNPRMTAQRAAFTISGDLPLPLDQEFPDLVKSGRLVKLVLPVSMYGDADRFLTTAGLTAFSFYPDLQGLVMRHEAESENRLADARRWYPEQFK